MTSSPINFWTKLLTEAIFDTGYREMPPQMYADWLRSVNDAKQKYQKKH